ncbi:MAG: J domain-containing protein [Chloroflexales bacterium]
MDDFEQLDHYELLGINRSASAIEIKHAYRQQMRRYHPDRVARAPADERAYANRRALRINAAYQTLSDFSARSVYNRSLSARTPPPPRPQAEPPRPRDPQAELYEQAHAHLDAGHMTQAAATLRELQQINPFYRDSAALLAQAEAAISQHPAPAPAEHPAPTSNRRTLLVGGIGSLLVAGIGAATWWLRRPTDPVLVNAATPIDTSVTAPTDTVVVVSPSPDPTVVPPSPTVAPPTVAPSATPELLAEDGKLFDAEEFRGSAWPTTSGNGWSVSANDRSYTITANPGTGNIWAYHTSQAGENVLIGVDVTVSGGEAGLLLRFDNADSYLSFFVNPVSRSFRLAEHTANLNTTLADGGHPAILPDAAVSNRLVARMEGKQIELRVNGQRVAHLSVDTPPPTARYGLAAVAGDSLVKAIFSNLHLRAL